MITDIKKCLRCYVDCVADTCAENTIIKKEIDSLLDDQKKRLGGLCNTYSDDDLESFIFEDEKILEYLKANKILEGDLRLTYILDAQWDLFYDFEEENSIA